MKQIVNVFLDYNGLVMKQFLNLLLSYNGFMTSLNVDSAYLSLCEANAKATNAKATKAISDNVFLGETKTSI